MTGLTDQDIREMFDRDRRLRQLSKADKLRDKARKLKNFTCSKCGGPAKPSQFVYESAFRMFRLRMCFDCTHWHLFLQSTLKDPKTNFVANGNGYTVGSEKAPNYRGARGFGGALFIFNHPDGTQQRSTNMWHRGTVDKAWREELPDTVTFQRC